MTFLEQKDAPQTIHFDLHQPNLGRQRTFQKRLNERLKGAPGGWRRVTDRDLVVTR